MKKYLAYVSTALALPLITFAQQITSIQSGGQFIINTINTLLVPVIFAIAFIVFLWGILQYFIFSNGDEEKQARGRSFILYGLVGFFLMVSVWGLVNILINSFSLQSGVPTYPTAPSY